MGGYHANKRRKMQANDASPTPLLKTILAAVGRA